MFCKVHSNAGPCLWLLNYTTTPVSSTSTSNAPMIVGIVAGVISLLVVGIIVYFCFCRAKKAPVQGMDGVVVEGKSKASTGSSTGTTKSKTKKTVSKY